MRLTEYSRRILLASIVGIGNAFLLWLVLRAGRLSVLPTTLAELTIGAAILGGYWMIYDSVRYERRSWPYAVCSLIIPYSFVWYYFERVRKRSSAQRVPVASRTDGAPPRPQSQRTGEERSLVHREPTGTMRSLRNFLWVSLALVTTAFCVWEVLGPWRPTTRGELALVVLVFGVHPLGALWMLYHCVRYEERPF